MPHRPIGLPHARIDLDRQTVQRAGEELALTVQEAALLAYLAERSGEAVSRADLLAQVWGYHPGLARPLHHPG